MPTHGPAAGARRFRPSSDDAGIRFKALAVDYDGTLAEDGRVAPETLEAARRAKRSGRKLLLVTGRELEELMGVFPELDVFDVVVAENGALLSKPCPPPPTERPLASAPPPELVRTLRERGVAPLCTGRIIVATRPPHEQTVMETIGDLKLELEVIFNKGAVMILPSGVNKALGLRAALDELGIDPRESSASATPRTTIRWSPRAGSAWPSRTRSTLSRRSSTW